MFCIFIDFIKKIPISVTYAIWGVAGMTIISAIGIIFFKENVSALKLVSILFIIVGVVGLNLSGASH